jgi:hypothetical protein
MFDYMQFMEIIRESSLGARILGYVSTIIGFSGLFLLYSELGFAGFGRIAMMIATMGAHSFVLYWVNKALHWWIIR